MYYSQTIEGFDPSTNKIFLARRYGELVCLPFDIKKWRFPICRCERPRPIPFDRCTCLRCDRLIIRKDKP